MLDNYKILNAEEINTPALAIYPSLVVENIKLALNIAGKSILRPHIKTCKTPEVIQLMLANGITHYKCATLAEAELLGIQKVKDVLLAYQPVCTAILRLKNIIQVYPNTIFSCLIDNSQSLKEIAEAFENKTINVFIDVNVGMNRTGVSLQKVTELLASFSDYPNVLLQGLHAYDGHINDVSLIVRAENANQAYHKALQIKLMAETKLNKTLSLVIGGTPTFAIHAQQPNVQCSPGTFILGDKGYSVFTDLQFTVAAIVLTRVISIIDKNLLCVDVGHKAVASENPLHQRLYILGINNVELISHSEEHLVVKVADTSKHHIGDMWYAVPYHICPTVALHHQLEVIENCYRTQQWTVTARNRKINY